MYTDLVFSKMIFFFVELTQPMDRERLCYVPFFLTEPYYIKSMFVSKFPQCQIEHKT